MLPHPPQSNDIPPNHSNNGPSQQDKKKEEEEEKTSFRGYPRTSTNGPPKEKKRTNTSLLRPPVQDGVVAVISSCCVAGTCFASPSADHIASAPWPTVRADRWTCCFDTLATGTSAERTSRLGVILGIYVMRPLMCNSRSACCPLLTSKLADVNRVLFTRRIIRCRR